MLYTSQQQQSFHSAHSSHNSPLYLQPKCASQYSFKHTCPAAKPFISSHILANYYNVTSPSHMHLGLFSQLFHLSSLQNSHNIFLFTPPDFLKEEFHWKINRPTHRVSHTFSRMVQKAVFMSNHKKA